jgi:hypothetical protein
MVMAGVVVGASVGGLLGAFMAVPVMATGRIVAQYAYNKVLGRPPFPAPAQIPPVKKRAGLMVPMSRSVTRLMSRSVTWLMSRSVIWVGKGHKQANPNHPASSDDE